MNRGGGARRNQRRQPPRSAGDVSDAQRGSTSPHPDGLVNAAAATSAPMADDKKAIEEPITTGRRRRAGSGAGTSEPAVAGPQRGGRPRNRGGNLEGGGNSRGGPVANASAPDRGTEECNGVTKTEGSVMFLYLGIYFHKELCLAAFVPIIDERFIFPAVMASNSVSH